MKTSSLIPYIPITHVFDFLLFEKEVSVVDNSTGVPRMVTKPNPRYWVSDMAMERAKKILKENDAAIAEAMKNVKARKSAVVEGKR